MVMIGGFKINLFLYQLALIYLLQQLISMDLHVRNISSRGLTEVEDDTNDGVLAIRFIIGLDFAVTRSSPEPLLRSLRICSRANCVGCDIVQADHAPEAGVAQGIFHGILVRHHGRNQEEVEEGLEGRSRETQGRGQHSRTSAHADDHGWK